MRYKGYRARVELDDDDILHGQVIGLRDFIVFEGKSVDEIRRSFHAAVDDYLKYCKTRGEKPDRPYSGKFLVRLDPDLHKKITCQSQREGKSLNSWVEHNLASAIKTAEAGVGQAAPGAQPSQQLKLYPSPFGASVEAKEA